MLKLAFINPSAPLAGAISCLLLGALFNTLRSAFTLTGRAGLDRWEDHPAIDALVSRWVTRWDILRSTLLLLSMVMEVGTIAFAMAALTPSGQPIPRHAALMVFAGTVFLFTISLEVLPAALSESYADRLTLLFLRPVATLSLVCWPLAWPFARLDAALHRRLMSGSDEDDHPTTEDAILSLMDQPGTTDLEEEEREIIRSVFDFGETVTREIMIPRVDMEGIEDTETIETGVEHIKDSSYSRFPVYHDSMDDILGIVHVKDLLRLLSEQRGNQRIINVAKPLPFVPESMPINDLLQLMRTEQAQLAIVVDEYGGTAGLVTLEDVIEELVGEIRDEYDSEEKSFQRLSDGSAILQARVLVEDANEALDIHIPTSEEYDSLGGYIFHSLGRVPRPGETVSGRDFCITIQAANVRQIHTIRIQRQQPDADRILTES